MTDHVPQPHNSLDSNEFYMLTTAEKDAIREWLTAAGIDSRLVRIMSFGEGVTCVEFYKLNEKGKRYLTDHGLRRPATEYTFVRGYPPLGARAELLRVVAA